MLENLLIYLKVGLHDVGVCLPDLSCQIHCKDLHWCLPSKKMETIMYQDYKIRKAPLDQPQITFLPLFDLPILTCRISIYQITPLQYSSSNISPSLLIPHRVKLSSLDFPPCQLLSLTDEFPPTQHYETHLIRVYLTHDYFFSLTSSLQLPLN